jgi:hypothetical protein
MVSITTDARIALALKCEEIKQQLKNIQLRHSMGKQFLVNYSVIALLDSKTSWVSRWQGLTHKVKGIYAIQVYGEITDDLVEKDK